MAEQHQPIDQVRAHKARTARHEDTLALRVGQQLDRGELFRRRVLDLVLGLVKDGLGRVVLGGGDGGGGCGFAFLEDGSGLGGVSAGTVMLGLGGIGLVCKVGSHS